MDNAFEIVKNQDTSNTELINKPESISSHVRLDRAFAFSISETIQKVGSDPEDLVNSSYENTQKWLENHRRKHS